MNIDLTLDEKIRLLNGFGSWSTYSANGKLPVSIMSDGPHGLRKQDQENYSDINDSKISTCFPTASCLSSSWNRETLRQTAARIGEEAEAENVDIVLGCGMNIKRSPLCGRNFEYFSEDPYLSGELAVSYVKGLQANGTGASIKHFAANSQEKRRQTSSSFIDERALREIYLPAFEKTVKEADPATIMESYNKLNGEYVSRSRRLLTDILRNEWGFKGAMISDWGAAINITECIKGGLDLAMPDSCGFHTKELKKALKEGLITEEQIDRAVENILRLVEKYHSTEKHDGISDSLFEEAHKTALEAACDSAVLLKNDGMLPLKEKGTIVIIGEMAAKIRFQGGGSSHITTRPLADAVKAFSDCGYTVLYQQGYSEASPSENSSLAEKAVKLAEKAAAENIPVLYFCGLTDRYEGEGFDRTNLDMPPEQLALMDEIIRTGCRITAVTFSGSPIALPFADRVNAILHMYLAGEASAEACAALVSGDVTPSGKLAETFPFSAESVPCAPWFAKETDVVEYRESLFVGYRYYETFKIPVKYEFGYGLSYTTFEYSDLRVEKSPVPAADMNKTKDNGCCSYNVTFNVKNTGAVKGKETAQIYVLPPDTGIIRPSIELKGFQKIELEPGETKKVEVLLDSRSFSIYSTQEKDFLVPAGTYTVAAASSVKDIRLTAPVEVEGTAVPEQKSAYPSYFPENQKNGSFSIPAEEFARLYSEGFEGDRVIPEDRPAEKGTFTLENSLASMAETSRFARFILRIMEKIVYSGNKDKDKDDPAVKIVIQGIKENPLESLISTSNGMLKPGLLRFIVRRSNRGRPHPVK